MSINNDLLFEQQLEREKHSATAGYERFCKNQEEQTKFGNGSNTAFGSFIKKDMLPKIIDLLQKKLEDISRIRESNIKVAISKCVLDSKAPSGEIKPHEHWDLEIAAFLAFQLTLDTALNPNKETKTFVGRSGGDKRLLKKKDYTELQREIGRVIQEQLSLRIIMKSFPEWFRIKSKYAEQAEEEGLKASTFYWNYRMARAMENLEKKLEDDQDLIGLEIVKNRNPWTSQDRSHVGAWLLTSVIEATGMFDVVKVTQNKRSTNEIYLTHYYQHYREQLHQICKDYQHQLLPMLVPPQPITNETLGGWFTPELQRPANSPHGSIRLSPKHLEFINRQAKVQFQINPFINALYQRLIQTNKSLGKFYYYERIDIPEVNQLLGFSYMDRPEQNAAIERLKKTEAGAQKVRDARHQVSQLENTDKAKAKKALLAIKLVSQAEELLKDESFFIPMSYDFRGRIYSRVPFTSFQSADPGRYLLRFAKKTPTDDRTAHWLQIGISNAAGNDKLSFGKRLQWFHNHKADIINIGQMLTTGDFTRAYDFLNQDYIDDPFALAALANEYVNIYINKTQDYTQTFVCVDASCSGSAIFNAWRRNRTAGKMVNLTNNDAPADIYTEVWNEIKRTAPDGVFDASHIEALEASKLIRKMMKQAFVPAQYASPSNRQRYALTRFNKNELTKANLAFDDEQMDTLKNLWDVALDEVSSISTVIEWFREQTESALNNGATEIKYVSENGSEMTLKYPKFKEKKIRTLHYGQARWREQKDQQATTEVNRKKLLDAVTANITHLTDAAALCNAMWDWDEPMVCIHDAVGISPSNHVDNAIRSLKDGLIQATEYDVWKQFRTINGLPVTPQTAGPVVGDLDLNEIKQSQYLFS